MIFHMTKPLKEINTNLFPRKLKYKFIKWPVSLALICKPPLFLD